MAKSFDLAHIFKRFNPSTLISNSKTLISALYSLISLLH